MDPLCPEAYLPRGWLIKTENDFIAFLKAYHPLSTRAVWRPRNLSIAPGSISAASRGTDPRGLDLSTPGSSSPWGEASAGHAVNVMVDTRQRRIPKLENLDESETTKNWLKAIKSARNEGVWQFVTEHMTERARNTMDMTLRRNSMWEEFEHWRWLEDKKFFELFDRVTQGGTQTWGSQRRDTVAYLKSKLSELKLGQRFNFIRANLLTGLFYELEDLMKDNILQASEKKELALHFTQVMMAHANAQAQLGPGKRTSTNLEVACIKEWHRPYELHPQDLHTVEQSLEALVKLYDEKYVRMVADLHRVSLMLDTGDETHSQPVTTKVGGGKSGGEGWGKGGHDGGAKGKDYKKRKRDQEEVNSLAQGIARALREGQPDSVVAALAQPKGQPKGGGKQPKQQPRREEHKGPKPPPCPACGKGGHAKDKCLFVKHKHPDVNLSSSSWAESTKGKATKETFNKDTIVMTKTLEQADHAAWQPKLAALEAEIRQIHGTFHIDHCTLDDIELAIHYLNACPEADQSSNTIPIQIYHKTDKSISHHRALIDTGALHADYISRDVATRIRKSGGVAKPCSHRVGTALAGAGTQLASEMYTIEVKIPNEQTKEHDVLFLPVKAIDIQYDLIVGRKTISKYRLLETLRKHLNGENEEIPEVSRPRVGRESDQFPVRPSGRLANLTVVEPASNYLDREEDAEGIELKAEDAPWQREIWNEAQDDEIPSCIEGPTEAHILEQQTCCNKYKALFSTKVRKEPANLGEEMKLDVDMELWDSMDGHYSAPRMMSKQRQDEVLRQVTQMRDLCVIEEAAARRYSQVLLTPKPNNKWRFCIDYVRLNQCTRNQESWPIPNIKQMLNRIGDKKPAFFAVMDLTSGYHQASIDPLSRFLTAFITLFGLFQWLRVPMGLKGAPSFFQRVMASIVLVGLMYVAVELYIDDLLVFGRTWEEYMTNLDAVFARLAARGITVNPHKCRLGLTSVEYVGYVIDNNGISMAHDRREEVFAIPKPYLGKHLKSFLGCAGYFRDFIPNYAEKTLPLNEMIRNYDRNKKIIWTPEAEIAWDQIREDIRTSQTLFFVDEHSPIYMHTDASDYGIGAYLFQLVNGKERCIALLSKTLTEAESRWNTTEKECYAFVYAMKKWEYLLRDTHFTLRTDHRNLTYINQSLSPKVRRWKIMISEYNFSIEYIPGPDNIIGDAMSRLVNKASATATSAEGEQTVATVQEPTTDSGRRTHKHGRQRKRVRRKSGSTTWNFKPYPIPKEARCSDNIDGYKTTQRLCRSLATLVEYHDEEYTEYVASLSEETIAAATSTGESEEDARNHGINLFDFTIPPEYYNLIAKAHNSGVGHMGVETTLKRLRELNYPECQETNPKVWKYQREHVRKFIRCCPACQMMSQLKVPIHTQGFTIASYNPMERLAVDSMGPFPADEYGNTAIIVIIDAFTRFVDMYAVPDMTARSAMRALMAHNKIFGQPHQIVSDNGTQYCCEIIDELLAIWGVEHLRTVAHSHEQNGIVERANKEVLRHLRALLFDQRTLTKWSDNIPIVQRIMNTTVHESIGVSPNQLLFGDSLDVTPEVYLPISALNTNERQLSTWAEQRLLAQKEIIERARGNQLELDKKHMQERNQELQSTAITVFAPGTWVKVAYPRSAMGQRAPNKMVMRWRGPYKVYRRLRGKYQVEDTSTNDILEFSEHLLQPYHVEPQHTSPEEVALVGRNMFIIEEVLDISGDANRRTSWTLLIKWQGKESPESCEWNYTFLHNALVHDKLRSMGGKWARVIPKQYGTTHN